MIGSDNPLCAGGDCTISESIVVWLTGDGVKTVSWPEVRQIISSYSNSIGVDSANSSSPFRYASLIYPNGDALPKISISALVSSTTIMPTDERE